jgi:UDP-N-acetylmuramyl pentapeptide phosphotransferase/UDP-N-acetylglucosamine-1-phosphate transferase
MALTKQLIHALKRQGVMDVPNDRSSHTQPTPRAGGLGVLGGMVLGTVVVATAKGLATRPAVGVAILLVTVGGLWDDLRGGLPAPVRLMIQLAGASILVWYLGPLERLPLPQPANIDLGVLAGPVSMLWVLGVVNLTNFLDGIDGFAGAQATCAGLGIALVACLADDWSLASMAMVLAAASLGFLYFNWQPAQIFLGDVGSSLIGMTLAASAWQASRIERSEVVFLVGILMFFFLADGSVTLTRRLLLGKRFWEPHRGHLYQRLVSTGIGHAQTVRRILALAVLPSLVAVTAVVRDAPEWKWVALLTAISSFVYFWRSVLARERQTAEMSDPTR